MGTKVSLGVDLGTSKTAIVTSDSRRICVPTAIGRPKDKVALRLLGRGKIFGEKLLDSPGSLEVTRPLMGASWKYDFEKGEGADPSSVAADLRDLLHYALQEIGLDKGDIAHCVIGSPACATFDSVNFVVSIGNEMTEQAIVVSEPFAVAYGIGKLADVIVVDIGAGTIDICPLSGTYPDSTTQATIPFGGDDVDHAIYEAVLEQYSGATCDLGEIRELKERYGTSSTVNATIAVAGRPQLVDLTKVVRSGCEALVTPIVDGVSKVLSQFNHRTQQRMLQKVVLSGGGSQTHGLDCRVEEKLRKHFGVANVKRVHDYVYAGAYGALKLAMDMPSENWQTIKEAA